MDFEKFLPSHSQKKVIRRFHNYLDYGDIKGPEKDFSRDVPMKEKVEAPGQPPSEFIIAIKTSIEN